MTLRTLALLSLLALGLLLGISRPALSQASLEAEFGVDLSRWERNAAWAERLVSSGSRSVPSLALVRGHLVEHRSAFLEIQDSARARLATLEGQIAALGPEPEDGAQETALVAERRAELQRQYEEASAPSIYAGEAYNRADGLISEIDAMITGINTDRLLERPFTPFSPAAWSDAYESLGSYVSKVRREVARAWASPEFRDGLARNWPAILGLLALAAICLTGLKTRAIRALGKAGIRLPQSAGFVAFTIHRLVMPVLGLLAIFQAAGWLGLAGDMGGLLLDSALLGGVCVCAARWIGLGLFPDSEGEGSPLGIDREAARLGRAAFLCLGAALGIRVALMEIYGGGGISDGLFLALSFPLTVFSGFYLYQASRVMRAAAEAAKSAHTILRQLAQGLALAAAAVAILAPLAGALGYLFGSSILIHSAVLTLGLFGLATLLEIEIARLFQIWSSAGRDSGEGAGLGMILVNSALVILAVPVLALIWGAELSDLREFWSALQQGVLIGERRLSVTDLLVFAAVFAAVMLASRFLQSILSGSVLPRTRIDAGGRNAVVKGTGYVGILLAGVLAVSSVGLDLSSLALFAGALSVGLGFGLQAVVSNFVSGLILLVERPVREGDWIEVAGIAGTVKKISVRSTIIETFDRAMVIVPNADLITGSVTNWTHTHINGRLKVPVGVAYGSDPREVERILLGIASDHEAIMDDPAPQVVFLGFGENSLSFELRGILGNVNLILSTLSEVNFEIERRLREAGIGIPFPQRELWVKNAGELGLGMGQPQNNKRAAK